MINAKHRRLLVLAGAAAAYLAVTLSLGIAGALLLGGCTSITNTVYPDGRNEVAYHTLLKDVQADEITFEKRGPTTMAVHLVKYKSSETKALEVADHALDVAAKATAPGGRP